MANLLSIVNLDILGSALNIGNVDDVLGCQLEDHLEESSEVEFLGAAGDKHAADEIGVVLLEPVSDCGQLLVSPDGGRILLEDQCWRGEK